MANKKAKSRGVDKKSKPNSSNEQLGENAGEGRFEKVNPKSGKCR